MLVRYYTNRVDSKVNSIEFSIRNPLRSKIVDFNYHTYLAENKCIEYNSILNIHSMLSSVIIQTENTIARKIEDQKDSNLIQSL